MKCNREAVTNFYIGTSIFHNKVFIQADIGHEAILGCDFIKTINIDFPNETLTINGVTTDINNETKILSCTTNEDTVIEGMTVCNLSIINPATCKEIENSKYVMVSHVDDGFMNDYNLEVGEGIYTNDEILTIPIANPNLDDIIIPKRCEHCPVGTSAANRGETKF